MSTLQRMLTTIGGRSRKGEGLADVKAELTESQRQVAGVSLMNSVLSDDLKTLQEVIADMHVQICKLQESHERVLAKISELEVGVQVMTVEREKVLDFLSKHI